MRLRTALISTAGADIKEISTLDAEGARQCRYLENLCQGLQSVRKPLVAAVEGMAVSVPPTRASDPYTN
jgi:enoyl-CoA hydratase